MDLVNHLLNKIYKNTYLGPIINHLFIDEVQDLTPAQSIFIEYHCQFPNHKLANKNPNKMLHRITQTQTKAKKNYQFRHKKYFKNHQQPNTFIRNTNTKSSLTFLSLKCILHDMSNCPYADKISNP